MSEFGVVVYCDKHDASVALAVLLLSSDPAKTLDTLNSIVVDGDGDSRESANSERLLAINQDVGLNG